MNSNSTKQTLNVDSMYLSGGDVYLVADIDGQHAVIINRTNGRVMGNWYAITHGTILVDTVEVDKAISWNFTPLVSHAPAQEEKTLRVVRHVRPSDIFSKELYGFTLVFDLNYSKRTIDVGISVCNGDRFNRKTGVELALSGRNYIKGLHMPDSIFDGSSKRGLVTWFIEDSIDENMDNDDADYNISMSTIELIIDMYYSSKNFFNNLDLE